MTIEIATPYSHLFGQSDVKRRIIELSDIVEIRGPNQFFNVTPLVLWHCELSLVKKWDEKHIAYLSSVFGGLRFANIRLSLVSLHLASRYQANGVVDGAFIGRGNPMSDDEMMANAGANAETVRTLLKQAGLVDARLIVENNNHLGSDAYDRVTEPEFIKRLLDSTGFGLLLDVAHARITAANTRWSEQDYFGQLPLERAEQVHLSRHDYRQGKAVDAHDALHEHDWVFFGELMPQLPNLQYATIEFYKNSDRLVDLLKRLRVEINSGGSLRLQST